jgi:hypothetical protein
MIIAQFNCNHVIFQGIIIHLKFYIFTSIATFHRFSISNVIVVDNMDIAMCFLGNIVMNEFMGVSIVD